MRLPGEPRSEPLALILIVAAERFDLTEAASLGGLLRGLPNGASGLSPRHTSVRARHVPTADAGGGTLRSDRFKQSVLERKKEKDFPIVIYCIDLTGGTAHER